MKNAVLYLLNSPLPDTEVLAECLEDAPSRRCQFDEESTIGFLPPVPDGAYALEVDGLTMFTAELTKVVLPAKVVKRETDNKIEEVTAKYGRELSESEKQQIKEAVRSQLIARSHQVTDQVEVRLDRSRSVLALDVTSSKKAEEVLSKLREVLGSLKVVPFATQEGAAAAMTRWLSQGRPDPANWRFSGSCRMGGSADGSNVVFDKCELVQEYDAESDLDEPETLGPTAEIEACLEQGRQCTEARFVLEGAGGFVLTQYLTLKSMKFSGTIPEVDVEDKEEARRLNYQATALLEWGLIGQVVEDLQTYLGEARIEAVDLEAEIEGAEFGDTSVENQQEEFHEDTATGEQSAPGHDDSEESREVANALAE